MSAHRVEYTVEVELRGFLPNYESLPDSEEARYEPLLKGHLQLECEARELGLWADVMDESGKAGLFEMADPSDRLVEMARSFPTPEQVGNIRKPSSTASKENANPVAN